MKHHWFHGAKFLIDIATSLVFYVAGSFIVSNAPFCRRILAESNFSSSSTQNEGENLCQGSKNWHWHQMKSAIQRFQVLHQIKHDAVVFQTQNSSIQDLYLHWLIFSPCAYSSDICHNVNLSTQTDLEHYIYTILNQKLHRNCLEQPFKEWGLWNYWFDFHISPISYEWLSYYNMVFLCCNSQRSESILC